MSTPSPDEFARHIDAHAAADVERLIRWSAINSGTAHQEGLARMAEEIVSAFAPLGATHESVELPPAESIDSRGEVARTPLGRGLRFVKRPDAPRTAFLCIHYDTVFAADHPFQAPRWTDDATINGPGVCDAKGGLIVMLAALRAIESSMPREQLGWEVYLNPDEEIGSPGSASFFRDVAKRHQIGLLFEPAMADGSLVGARKGSGGFTAVVRGRAAHAGRDFRAGRSATVALAELIAKFDALNRDMGGEVTVNCGRIEGGGAVNVVPDLAIGRFNVRVGTTDEMLRVEGAMRSIAREFSQRDGIRVEIHGGFASPPKSVDPRTRQLFDLALSCGKDVGLNLAITPSGGTCDGNKLAAAGMSVIDSLGPEGGEIHSDREFVRVPSIAQRAKLTALLLARLARDPPI